MERLPKYVQNTSGGKPYQVTIPIIGENKNKYIGKFDSVSDAVNARDNYLKENMEFHKGGSKNPYKGVIWNKGCKKWVASLQFIHGKNKSNHVNCHLGSYETAEEASKARINFIESLK